MKLLILIIILLLALGQALKAQENDTIPPPIDFKEYVALMNPKMCDSIYRVDTLYYPFEGDVQMIEIRFKTIILDKIPCQLSKYYNYFFYNAFFEMQSIFIFRDRANHFKKIYNNTNNFIIQPEKFQNTAFINRTIYPNDYILIETIKRFKNPRFEYYQRLQGLINHQGDIILEPLYYNITFYKDDKSIKLTGLFTDNMETNIFKFIDYYTFQPTNNNTYYNVSPIPSSLHYQLAQITPSFEESDKFIINNRGEIIIDETIRYLYFSANMFVLFHTRNKCSIVNQNFQYIIPPIYDYLAIILKENGSGISCLKARIDKKHSIIDLQQKILIPSIYDLIHVQRNFYIKKNCFIVKKDNLFGLYNHKYKLVMPIEYDSIIIYNNHIQAKKDGKWIIYDMKFKDFLKTDFNQIISEIGCFLLKKDNETHILYGLNKPELKYKPTKYKEISYSHIDTQDTSIILKAFENNEIIEIKLIE